MVQIADPSAVNEVHGSDRSDVRIVRGDRVHRTGSRNGMMSRIRAKLEHTHTQYGYFPNGKYGISDQSSEVLSRTIGAQWFETPKNAF